MSSYYRKNPPRIEFPISVSWELNFILNCENTWEQYRLPRSVHWQTQWPTSCHWCPLSGFLDSIDSTATKDRNESREVQELSERSRITSEFCDVVPEQWRRIIVLRDICLWGGHDARLHGWSGIVSYKYIYIESRIRWKRYFDLISTFNFSSIVGIFWVSLLFIIQ